MIAFIKTMTVAGSAIMCGFAGMALSASLLALVGIILALGMIVSDAITQPPRKVTK